MEVDLGRDEGSQKAELRKVVAISGLRNSSIGAFGVYPCVERKTGRFGFVLLYVWDNAFRSWPEIAAIRDTVSTRLSN